MITHVVSFKFADPTDVTEAIKKIKSLRGQIPSLQSLKCGSDTVGRPDSYDLVLITEHLNEQGLTDYIESPAHVEVISWIRPRVTARAAVDTDDLG